jgi:hypothetical protein
MINKNNNECETKVCNYPTIRTRFYNGMLLTDQHLRDEQQYHREKLKSVNRHLFGAGIVCGLKVTAPKVGLCVKIDPGVALDCCGNLIEVCKCISLDLSKLCKEKYGQSCIATEDSTPRVIRKNLVLSYKETESDPEPVLTAAADCRSAGDESKCQQSKVKEGYCIELWDEDKCPCMETKRDGAKPGGEGKSGGDVPTTPNPVDAPKPGTEQGMMQARTAIRTKTREDVLEAFLEDNPLPCYPCGCCENSVGLASLEIDCVANTVKVEYTCRTYVISPRLIRWIVSSIQTKEGVRRSLLDYMPASGGETEQGGGETPKETTLVDTTDKSTKKSGAAAKKAAEKNPGEAEAQPAPIEEPKK